VEKQTSLGISLILGLLKYWPITSPGKEVIFINEIEEVLELLGSGAEQNFPKYGGLLLR